MTYPDTAMDKIRVELHGLAKGYAAKAAALVSDPYLREGVVKVAVSDFDWAFYHAFEDDFSRHALNHELKVQSAAVDRGRNGQSSTLRI